MSPLTFYNKKNALKFGKCEIYCQLCSYYVMVAHCIIKMISEKLKEKLLKIQSIH
jgi:hypothetical protein